MEDLIRKETIKELICNDSDKLVLDSNDMFDITSYKMIRNNADNIFVRCFKVLFNGKAKLVYLTGSYNSLIKMQQHFSESSFLTFLCAFFKGIISIKNNGFLNLGNIRTRVDKIYVDPENYLPKLEYIPIKLSNKDNDKAEYEIRSILKQYIQSVPLLNTEKIRNIYEMLSNDNISIEQIYKQISDSSSDKKDIPNQEEKYVKPEKYMLFTSLEYPTQVNFTINTNKFVIGRKADKVDGVVGFSPMIGRVHCTVYKDNDSFYIVDEHSQNGTYVNERRVLENERALLSTGDIVKLAQSNFRVQIQEEQ